MRGGSGSPWQLCYPGDREIKFNEIKSVSGLSLRQLRSDDENAPMGSRGAPLRQNASAEKPMPWVRLRHRDDPAQWGCPVCEWSTVT